jgi:predicted Zn-dependent peptidase
MPIHEHRYPNGLVLVAESMQSLESVAFTFLLPVGAAYDPSDRAGLTSVTCEMALRGCGDLDSRQYVERLESLGIETGESVTVSHTCYRSAMLADHLGEAVRLYGDLLLRPRLPTDELESSRQVAVQEYRALDDELLQKVMVELRRGHYPKPWGQSHHGNIDGLSQITLDDIRRHFAGGYRPNGTILGVAGKFSWDELKETVGEVFGSWEPGDWSEPDGGALKVHRNHLKHDSNQTQIALAYPSIPYKHEDYFQAWGAVGVLSEGSSSRLFTEVREKRGLCYSVGASTRSLRQHGSVFCHAGTTAERAQETLDVMIAELVRLAEGIEPEELDRLKAKMKSSLIMSQESSMARAGALARDWYHLERVRPLEEISARVDSLTPASINRYLTENPPADFTVVTLGPQSLEMPDAVL